MHTKDFAPFSIAVTIDPVTVKIANWLLIRQPEQ